ACRRAPRLPKGARSPHTVCPARKRQAKRRSPSIMKAQTGHHTRTVSLPRPHILLQAVISALGVYAATLANDAQASCNQGDGVGFIYKVCQGADGIDGNSSGKKGKAGETLYINGTGTLKGNASGSLSYPVTGNVPGVFMGY